MCSEDMGYDYLGAAEQLDRFVIQDTQRASEAEAAGHSDVATLIRKSVESYERLAAKMRELAPSS